jgi:hypothetical protein
VERKLTIETLIVRELFSEQLFSTNRLNKSAVKREVSLVSFRNFLVCQRGVNDVTPFLVGLWSSVLNSEGMGGA